MKIITCVEPTDVSFFLYTYFIVKGKKKGQSTFIVIFLNVSGMKVSLEVSTKALVWIGWKDQLLLESALLPMTQYVTYCVRL
jgi:hypothetical protein